MRVVPVAVKDGAYTLYDAEGDCVGRACTEVGRAIIGDAFYARERTCRIVEDEDGCSSCSECGAHYLCMSEASYCPDCGAKVVRDD